MAVARGASLDALVAGTYVDGLFGVTAQRTAWVASFDVERRRSPHLDRASLDTIAAGLEADLDIDGLIATARGRR